MICLQSPSVDAGRQWFKGVEISGYVTIVFYASGCQMVWSQDLFTLLKNNKDPKVCTLEDFYKTQRSTSTYSH